MTFSCLLGPVMQRVTSREFQRNFGRFQDEALKAPLSITPNGRERLVILSAEEYTRLKRRDRQAIAVENLSDAEGGREALVAPITHRPPPDTVGAVAIPPSTAARRFEGLVHKSTGRTESCTSAGGPLGGDGRGLSGHSIPGMIH